MHRKHLVLLTLFCATAVGWQTASSQTTSSPRTADEPNQSERSDTLTGGRIETADFAANQPDIRLTLNLPSFRLTLWQNGKEVKSYYVGVGMRAHPLYIGDREVNQLIWNPDWIPPSSDWVAEIKGVSPGEVIKASDPRNPLGKMKIPLGDRYLIHQAAKASDLGNLVSHGCIRMLRPDIYDLAEKIIAARNAPVSPKLIAAAKRTLRMLVVNLDEPVPVDINYDTLVIEQGALHIYPDVYGKGTNRPARLRAELQAASVDVTNLSEKTLIRKRQLRITWGLADALDLMVVTMEAGLGLNSAMVRVSDELKDVHPDISKEFELANLEVRVGRERNEALRNLVDRTGVDDLRSLVAMLIQADRFGTSIAKAVRAYADALRTKRRQRAEQAAQKAAFKLLFPLGVFLFPTLFIMVLGPAMLNLPALLDASLGGVISLGADIAEQSVGTTLSLDERR